MNDMCICLFGKRQASNKGRPLINTALFGIQSKKKSLLLISDSPLTNAALLNVALPSIITIFY